MATRKKRQLSHPTRKKDKLTGNPIRRLSFLEWKNNSAALETMRGKTWKSALKKERTFWNALVKKAHITQLQKDMEKELRSTSKLSTFYYLSLGNGQVNLQVSNGSNYYWKWVWAKKLHYAGSLDYWDNKVYYITADEKDEYISNLTCQDSTGHILWSKHGISGQVAIKDGLCYYVGVIYPFNTIELLCCDALTGKDNHVILKEPSDERYLILTKETDKTLYCKSTCWTDSKTWRIEGKRAHRIHADTEVQYPLGSNCGFYIKKGTYTWIPYGQPLISWNRPKGEPAWVNLNSGHYMIRSEGTTTLYLCAPHKAPKEVFKISFGDVNSDPWGKWHGATFQSFTVYTPQEPPYVLFVENNTDSVKRWRHSWVAGCQKIGPFLKEFDPLDASLHHCSSADGTKVPYSLVKSKKFKRLRGLLCYIYSAYGQDTNVGWPYSSWGPLLRRGIGIVYCYGRGSGDKDYAWAKAGQEEHHIKTVEDFEGAIRAAQKVTGVSPNKTIIYGRSAGGMMVSATLLRNPTGSLMGAMYTEVPFTDLLRTQTNMTIDLTPSGVSEYGNPSENPMNFHALLKLSVMENMPEEGAPGVFVLCRTGLKDLQVLPYEPVKLIKKLRGTQVAPTDPNNKFLNYEKDEAHSSSYGTFIRTRATDLALLIRFLENKI